MLRSIEESLKRMQLDYIDIVVHHAPIPEIPIEESIKALNTIVDKGLARGIAVSNYNSKSIKQALDATDHPILFNQVYYNLFIREIEDDGLMELCNKNNILIQAYRPLELGELSKHHSRRFDELAKKYSLTSAQLALSWLTSQNGVVLVCTTHNQKHLRLNLEAMHVTIEKEDIETLRSEFPRKKLDKIRIR